MSLSIRAKFPAKMFFLKHFTHEFCLGMIPMNYLVFSVVDFRSYQCNAILSFAMVYSISARDIKEVLYSTFKSTIFSDVDSATAYFSADG